MSNPLRGRRDRDATAFEHNELIRHVDGHLGDYLAVHGRVCAPLRVQQAGERGMHGLAMRLALSCLVDADHSSSAAYDAGEDATPGENADPKWVERLRALEIFVAGKDDGTARSRDRTAFFAACRDSQPGARLTACEGPVGIGKTTAVTAYLLGRAIQENLRHIFVVAPYTNIITQTVKRLREALVLPGERGQDIVAEHHHRAEFEAREDRDLATLWRAPVIVTTAVQFFETLAACQPARLRKLHELPGSAVFLDEAHAALPALLWPQNWLWVRELAERWGCHFVFASGSLARFWQLDRIVPETMTVPDLVAETTHALGLRQRLGNAERERVRFQSIAKPLTLAELRGRVEDADGPRLVVVNTVASAAAVAHRLRRQGEDVLHLSTALCPRDRETILRRVEQRLSDPGDCDWTLVATSVVEAGVDLSFRTAFRERAGAASLIQIGGRVNRHNDREGGMVYDFVLRRGEEGVTPNPGLKQSADVLFTMLREEDVNERDAADFVTEALERELEEMVTFAEELTRAEAAHDYPGVAKKGKVIDEDTVLCIVDPELRGRLEQRESIDHQALLRGSVQIRRSLGPSHREPLPGRTEIYAWTGRYDPEFLGIMAELIGVETSQESPKTGA